MFKFASLALVALFALPLSAQVMGSTQAGAPVLTKAFAFSNKAKLTVEYTAVTMGGGKTFDRIKSEPQMREMVNRRAARTPIGHVEVTGELMLAGKKLPAGKHAMYFTYSDSGKWMLNLQPKSDDAEVQPISFEIPLAEAKTNAPRLVIDLIPVEETSVLHFGISFGKESARIPVTTEGE